MQRGWLRWRVRRSSGHPLALRAEVASDLAGCRAAAPSLGGQPIGTGWNSTPHRACTERVAGLYTPRCPIADHQDIHIKPRATAARRSVFNHNQSSPRHRRHRPTAHRCRSSHLHALDSFIRQRPPPINAHCSVSPCIKPNRSLTLPWRAPASVDSQRSGTMVYEEKNGSGIDTPEVHRRV
jgi:hypothetical protein